jgi:hypothetical protein
MVGTLSDCRREVNNDKRCHFGPVVAPRPARKGAFSGPRAVERQTGPAAGAQPFA